MNNLGFAWCEAEYLRLDEGQVTLCPTRVYATVTAFVR